MPLKKRSFFIQIISSRLFIITSVGVLIFLGVSLSKELARRVEINQRVSSLKTEIASLEKDNTKLSDLINYLKSENYREREARLKLGLEKPGENVIILPNNNNFNVSLPSGNTPSDGQTSVQKSSNKWWQYFFNK